LSLSQTLAGIADAVEHGEIPGAVILVAGLDRVHAHEAIGASTIGGTPMRRDSLFRIASMTKPVVSATAMWLVEAGRLRLEDPVARHLPALSTLAVLKSPQSGEIEPAERPVTVLDLLTHRAGFAYPGTAEGLPVDLLRAFNAEFLPNLREDEWLERLAQVPLMHQPGKAFTYGFSTDVLGLLIAGVEGQSLGRVLKDRIFGPLGMDQTTFRVSRGDRERLVGAYSRDLEHGALTKIAPALDCQVAVDGAFESGGAGLVSTARDYLRFARFLLSGQDATGKSMLSQRSLALMTSNHLTPEQRRLPTFGLPDYWSEQGFGLGVSVLDRPGAARSKSVGRYGWAGAYGTLWLNEPCHGLTALLMAQVMTLEAQPSYELRFEADLHEALP
jgi:CubicO group peptidase (beta-lactamase class C family)